MQRTIIGITGAIGFICGVRLLQVLHELPGVKTDLILSRDARDTLARETEGSMETRKNGRTPATPRRAWPPPRPTALSSPTAWRWCPVP